MRPATLLCICAFVLTAGCASTGSNPPQSGSAIDKAATPRFPNFVEYSRARTFFADPVALLPPPPAEGSALFEIDKKAYTEGRSLKGTQAWNEARMPPTLNKKDLGDLFSKAMDIELSVEKTPDIIYLLTMAQGDAQNVTRFVKKHYQRTRPYIYFNKHTCSTLKEEDFNRKSGSYPSGHSASGWIDALILAEINPQRADELLKTGLRIGDSRVICGFHWKSDVEQARVVASYVYAQLHAEPAFMKALKNAKEEFARIKDLEKK